MTTGTYSVSNDIGKSVCPFILISGFKEKGALVLL